METIQEHFQSCLHVLGSYPTYEEWKLFNGSIFHNFILSSYPTYEEWKLQYFKPLVGILTLSSYPTYEEWKQETFTGIKVSEDGSYPTYEEWKLCRYD